MVSKSLSLTLRPRARSRPRSRARGGDARRRALARTPRPRPRRPRGLTPQPPHIIDTTSNTSTQASRDRPRDSFLGPRRARSSSKRPAEPRVTWRPPRHRPRVTARASARHRARRRTRAMSSSATATTRASSTKNGVDVSGPWTTGSDGSWTSRARHGARALDTSRSRSSRCFCCSVRVSGRLPTMRGRRARRRGDGTRRRRRGTECDSTEAVERRKRERN